MGVDHPPQDRIADSPGADRALAAAVAWQVAWEAFLWFGPFDGRRVGAPVGALLVGAVPLLLVLVETSRRGVLPRRGTVVALVAVQALAFLLIHSMSSWALDAELRHLYPRLGDALRSTGELPSGPWPPLALALFALAGAIGSMAVVLPLLTLPVVLGAVVAIARPGGNGAWMVAAVALWPAVTIFWELRFEPLPASLAVMGLVAARRRPGVGAALLGLGAMVKWYPGLALVPLVLAAARVGDVRRLRALVVGAALPVAVVAIAAALAGQLDALVDPYRFQGGRGVTGESLPFLGLWSAGLADAPARAWHEVSTAPGWAVSVASAMQFVLLAVLCGQAWRHPRRATAWGAIVTAAALALNRVYSPQYLFAIVLLLALASSLAEPSSRSRSALAVSLGLAAIANAAVYPGGANDWLSLQWAHFLALAVAFAVTVQAVSERGDVLTDSGAT